MAARSAGGGLAIGSSAFKHDWAVLWLMLPLSNFGDRPRHFRATMTAQVLKSAPARSGPGLSHAAYVRRLGSRHSCSVR